MSSSRNILSAFQVNREISPGAVEVHARQASTLSYSQIVLLFILAFLEQFMLSSADSVYARDPSTNINYKTDYNPPEFPSLKSALMEFCKAILYDEPQAIYTGIDSPHCVSERNMQRPGISLSVEVGKNITENFESCINQMMQLLCDDYYDRQSMMPNVYLLYGGAALIGLVLIGGCVKAISHACTKIYANQLSSPSSSEESGESEIIVNTTNSSYQSTATTYINNNTLSSSPNILWNNNTNTDTAHHSHHDTVSVAWTHHPH
jgi:hypothetical protein